MSVTSLTVSGLRRAARACRLAASVCQRGDELEATVAFLEIRDKLLLAAERTEELMSRVPLTLDQGALDHPMVEMVGGEARGLSDMCQMRG